MAAAYVELAPVTYIRETDTAVLVRYEGDEYWIPHDQLGDTTREEMAEEICRESGVVFSHFELSEWISKEKGMI